jgi:hypothetical protein
MRNIDIEGWKLVSIQQNPSGPARERCVMTFERAGEASDAPAESSEMA